MADNTLRNFFTEGMDRDQHPSVQRPNSYRLALNAIHEDKDIRDSGLINERSNKYFATVPGTIVGYSFIEERDKFLVFHVNGGSTISWVDTHTGEVTKIVSDTEFGCNWKFKECEWIYSEQKPMRPCNEIMVYWASGTDYYKANIDLLLDPKRRSDETCEDFQLFNCVCAPLIKAMRIEGGGFDLVSGAIQYAAQLEDEDGKKSNWFHASQPVFIESPNNDAGEPSTDSVQVTLTNLDPRFNKVNIAAIKTTGGVLEVNKIASLYYNTNGITFNHYGTTGREEPLDIKEIIVKTRKYFRGTDLIQKDGMLFLYNLLQENNLEYQHLANNIKAEWVAYRIAAKDAAIHRSMMRDETYAPALVWNYCDGTSSFGYHIPAPDVVPGTAKLCNDCGTVALQNNTASSGGHVSLTGVLSSLLTDSDSSYNGGSGSFTQHQHEIYPASQDYDYDRFDAEVATHDPTTPSTNHQGDGDNASTKIIDKIETALPNVNIDSTCGCEECVGDVCVDTHEMAQNMFAGAGDFAVNLEDKDSDATDSNGDIKVSGQSFIQMIKNKKEKRVKTPNTYYSSDTDIDAGGTGTGGSGAPSGIKRSKNLTSSGDCDNVLPVEIDSGPTGTFISTELYPMTKNCEGEYIYRELAGKPIRYHRMPDNKRIPHYISTQNGVPHKQDINNLEWHNTDVILLGMRFSNIQFPPEDCLPKPLCPNSPYKIVYVKRDETNKSIIAKGITHHIFEGESHGRKYAFPKHAVNSREYIDRSIVIDAEDSNKKGTNSDKAAYTFHSPDTLYNTPPLAVDAFKPELELFGSGWRHGLYADGEEPMNIYDNRVDQRGARQAVNLNHYKEPATTYQCVSGITYAPSNKVVLHPEGIDLSLMNLWRESSVYFQMRGSPMVMSKGIDGSVSDTSFLGDGLDHECPIPYAGSIYGSLKRHIPNQYGSVVNQKYADLGLNAKKKQGSIIEGICGDIWIGLHSYKRTSYISNKVGEDNETEKIENPPYTGILKYLQMGDCTENPKNGDTDNPKNYSNMRPDEPCFITQGDPGESETDIYYPKVVSTLVSYWAESEVNTWLKQTGEAELGQVQYPKLKTLELDSTVPTVPWKWGYLNRFHVEVRRPSKWKLAVANAIRALVNLIPAAWLATDVFNIDSNLDLGFASLEALMTTGLWMLMNFVLFTPKNIRRILGLPECEPDRRGGNLNEEVRGLEDNYNKYNYDYSLINDKNIHLGMPDPYNTCKCKDDACSKPFTTNDIFYSNKQITDSFYDAYTNFEANDYLAIPAHSGTLQKLFIESNKFYAHTTDGIHLLQYSNGSFNIDERTALMGRGNLLADPQKYMEGVPEGYLGLRDPNACINTAYGYFFVDREATTLFRFQNGQATPITIKGMYNFFKESMNFCKTSCCDDEHTKKGSYYTLGVDYRHTRLLFTKHDLESCGSFTVSYNVMGERWTSFHSYVPELYLWDRNRMWTLDGNQLWEHNVGVGFQNFYGKYYPHMIEFVAKPDNLEAVQYKSTMLDTQADVGGLRDRDITFNKMSLRTSVQSTGILNLHVRTSSDDSDESIMDKIKDLGQDIEIVRKNKEWRINEVYDFVSDPDQPLVYYNCTGCNTSIEEINQSNIDYSILNEQSTHGKTMYDKYLIYRYIFDNPSNSNVRLLTRTNRTLVDVIVE